MVSVNVSLGSEPSLLGRTRGTVGGGGLVAPLLEAAWLGWDNPDPSTWLL